jgi:2'-5' RNA ligase
METKHPTYITVDIPEPVNSAVREMRRTYGNMHEQIPVEITIAGSSGVGPIPVGTSLELIYSEVDRIAANLASFKMNYKGLTKFPHTLLSYLEPENRSIFDQWHELFSSSAIPFSENPFPYNPHCTIRRFSDDQEYDMARKNPFPKEVFEVITLSVYDLCEEALECHLLYRVELRKNE